MTRRKKSNKPAGASVPAGPNPGAKRGKGGHVSSSHMKTNNPSSSTPTPQASNGSLRMLEEKVKAMERQIRAHDEEQEHGTPETKRTVRAVICPDELDNGQQLPVLPIDDPRQRFPLLLNGTNQETYVGGVNGLGVLTTLAPGQHSFALRIGNVVAGAGSGNKPISDEYLLVNVGGVSPALDTNNLSFPDDQLPNWVPMTVAAPGQQNAFVGPLPVQQYIAGWVATSPLTPPPPARITHYSGNLWHTYSISGPAPNHGKGVFLKTQVVSKPLLVIGNVDINVPAGGSGVTAWAANTLQVSFTDGIMTWPLSFAPITTTYGSEVLHLTDVTSSPVLGDTVMSNGYPRLYPAVNYRALTLTSVLSNMLLLEAVSMAPGSLITDSDAPMVPGDFDTLKASALQVQVSELNPMDSEYKGFNLRAGLLSAPEEFTNVFCDLACAGIPGNAPVNATEQLVFLGVADVLKVFPSVYAQSGWGMCCGVSFLRFFVPPGTTVPLAVDTHVWMESVPPIMSGLPLRPGKFDPAFERSLQQTVALPVLATYHSFKDFLKGAVRKVVKAGKSAATEAWKVGKEVAISTALAALLG